MITILVLDAFEMAEFSWTLATRERIDLVYSPLDHVSSQSRIKSGQALTIMGLAIDLFDKIIDAQFKTSDFVFIGTGLGAMICLQLAILLRGRDDMNVAKLFLLSACSSAPSRGFLLQSTKLSNSPLKYLELLVSPTYQPSKDLQSKFADNFRKFASFLEEVIDAIQEFHLSSEEIMLLTEIPTLFLHGDRNQMIDQTHSIMLADHWHASSRATLLHLPNTGHWPQVEQPERLAQVLKKWLLPATRTTGDLSFLGDGLNVSKL